LEFSVLVHHLFSGWFLRSLISPIDLEPGYSRLICHYTPGGDTPSAKEKVIRTRILKETVDVISCVPPFQEWHVRLITALWMFIILKIYLFLIEVSLLK